MKKIFAVPVEGDVLSAHFGSSEAFAFVEVEGNTIVKVTRMETPVHEHGAFPRFVAAHGATDVIAGGMGPHAVNLFKESGINVYLGAPIDRPENLVRDFLQGVLKLSANYCSHDDQGHDHDHHSHHGHGHHPHH
ncbi:MAG: NifB/NifX family molybdenum-iron cluster-binding protein [Bacteroidales bacterium]